MNLQDSKVTVSNPNKQFRYSLRPTWHGLQQGSRRPFTNIPEETVFTHQSPKFLLTSFWGEHGPFVLVFEAQGDLFHLCVFLSLLDHFYVWAKLSLRYAITIPIPKVLQNGYQTLVCFFNIKGKHIIF